MTLPNFLIVGAARSGTTSLHYYLRQHPMIFMHPAKELNFFAFEGHPLDFKYWGEPPTQYLTTSITDFKKYVDTFSGVRDQTVLGEASTVYLYWETAPERIRYYRPDCKIVAILRQPVERGFSHFIDLRRKNREPYAEYQQAVTEEDQRRKKNWLWDYYYRDVGFYYAQVKRYLDTFNPAQVRIFLYEELTEDTPGLVRQIFQFLEVDDGFIPDVTIRHNPSGIPKSPSIYAPVWRPGKLRRLLKLLLPEKVRQWMLVKANEKMLERPELSREVRQQLIEDYRADILKLQDLLKKDLSHWLE